MSKNKFRWVVVAFVGVVMVTGPGFRIGRAPRLRWRGGGCGCGKLPIEQRLKIPKVDAPPKWAEMPKGLPEAPTLPESPKILLLRPELRPPDLPLGREPVVPRELPEIPPPKLVRQFEGMRELAIRNQWAELARPAQEALNIRDLPPELAATLKAVEHQAPQIKSLEELTALIASNRELPGAETLQHHLQILGEATGNPRLNANVRDYLVIKAQLNGQAKLAASLATSAALREDPHGLLRDLQIRVLGEPIAEVPAKPPFQRGPIPEGPSASVRPIVKETARADLPKLKRDMAAIDKQLSARLRADLSKQVEMHRRYLLENIDCLHSLTHPTKDDEERQRQMRLETMPARVVRLLGRDLTPGERFLAAELHKEGKESVQIANLLVNLDSKRQVDLAPSRASKASRTRTDHTQRLADRFKEIEEHFEKLRDRRSCLAYSPDGKWIATGGKSRSVRLCDGTTLREVSAWDDCHGLNCLIFTSSGDRLVAGGGGHWRPGWLQILDLTKKSIIPLATYTWQKARVETLAMSRDGTVLAAAIHSEPELFERTRSGDWVQLWQLKRGKLKVARVLEESGEIGCLALSKNGRWLAVARHHGISLWDLSQNDKKPSTTLWIGHPVVALAFSTDRQLLIAWAGDHLSILAWDGSKAGPTFQGELPFLDTSVRAAVFAPDCRTFTAAAGGIIRVWDIGGQRPQTRAVVHTIGGPVDALALGQETLIWCQSEDVGIVRFRQCAELKNLVMPLDKMLAHDPRNVKALVQRGRLYLGLCQGRSFLEIEGRAASTRAIADFTAAFRTDANCAAAYFHRGLARACCQEIDQAIADFTQILKLDPRHAQGYYQRGRLYAKKKQYIPARADLDRAFEIDRNLANDVVAPDPTKKP
jgi:WD40 repeat protein